MRTRGLFLGVALGVATLGCGDDGGGGKGGSGVSSSKRVNELSEQEFDRVCDHLANKFDDVASSLLKFQCTLESLIAGNSCQEQRSECIDSTPAEEVFDEQFDCTTPPEGLEDDCDATVGEIEACANALQDWANELSEKVTCEADLSDLEDLQDAQAPEACQKLDSACGLDDVVEEGVSGE